MKKKIIVILICIVIFGTVFSALGTSAEYKIKSVINVAYNDSDSEIIRLNDNEILLIGNLASNEVIDQQQTSSYGQGCPFFSYLWIAQGFIPSLEILTKVEVKLFKGGNPTSPIIISIRDSLSGNDLTSVSVDGSLVSQYSKWIEFNFPDINVIEAWGSISYGVNWDLIEDYYPEYPEPDACFKTYGLDESPNIPIITGETNGDAGTEYAYTFSTTDPESHDLYYYVKWGDDTTSGWIGEYASGETVPMKHIWQTQGTYTIEAKAKDIYGVESDWATLEVTMPVNQPSSQPSQPFQKITQQLPSTFSVLRQLLGL
jgi:hypothetical protein